MIKYILYFIGLTVTAPNSAYAQELKPLEMKRDLDYLVTELEARHANLYHSITQEDFKDSLNLIENDLPNLSRIEFIMRLAKLTALIGDGHTGLFLPWGRGFNFRKIPIKFHYGEEGYFIISASNEYKNLIGKRLKGIGGISAEQVKNTIVPLLPKDNEIVGSSFAGTYMQLFELLAALGYTKLEEKEVRLTLSDLSGEEEEVIVKPVNNGEKVEWVLYREKEKLPLFLRNQGQPYWFEYLPEDKSIFLQFNSADISAGVAEREFLNFTDSLVTSIDENDIDKLIIDLRWNSGGSFTRTRYLLWAVIRSEKINQTGRLFTITGPGTFSAATALATELDLHTETLFIGEPTGGKPNSFGDLGRITLPNSKIEVWYSRWEMHQSLRSDHRPAIFPDFEAPFSLQDYIENNDPALKAIINYKPKKPISHVIEKIINEEGIDSAVKTYWYLRNEEFNSYNFSEDQLNTLGYKLLKKDKKTEALEVFKINAEVFPYSPNSYDSLGDAFRALNKLYEALINYQKAFAIDKQYSHSRDKAQEILTGN